MNADNRDWGRINPIDYVPFLGMVYRLYWWSIARRGEHREAAQDGWEEASYSELSRLLVALVFTVGFGVFVVLGGPDGGLKPAFVFVVAGVFVHKVASALTDAF